MTNKEKYKQAFSVLHPSFEISLEDVRMEQNNRKNRLKHWAAAAAACMMVFGGASAAYAADVGGIQRKLQLWIHGDLTDVTVEFNGKGQYTASHTDTDGQEHVSQGGGLAIEWDGTERPLTEQELTEHLPSPQVEYLEDGSVWVYWYDQKVEITDKFEDGICYVKLDNGEKVLYMTVRYQDGYATSPRKYVTPSEF